jgi:hypothetical protein
MTNLIWHRDQQSDITHKGDLTYKCWRTARGKVYIPADIAPNSPFLTDSVVADLIASSSVERIGP